MGVNKWRHRGREKLVLSKIWPDGTRFRRFMPNRTVAKELETRIDYAITIGTWLKLREQLIKGRDPNRKDAVSDDSGVHGGISGTMQDEKPSP